MKITETSVRHPVTTIMVFIGVAVLGLVSLSRLALELFPDVSLPTLAVVTVYPGVGPLEVESGVTKPLEDAFAGLNGVETVSSQSSEGISLITASFTWGTDIDAAVADVREAVNEIQDDFPEGVQRPFVVKFNPAILPVLSLTVSSATEGLDLRGLAEDVIKPELQRIPGVASVDLSGGTQRACLVLLDIDSLGNHGIPIAQVLRVFQTENVNLPAGSITAGDRYLVMRTIGEFATPEDLGEMLVGYQGGVPVFLRDVAAIRVGDLPQEEFVTAGGVSGLLLSVRKQPLYNTVEVSRNVHAALESLQNVLPPSVNVGILEDQATTVQNSIANVGDSAWQGGLLAIVVLVLFLRNVRSTFVISLSIPGSIVATFALMNVAGITLNITSLLGLTLGVGMFVDNSIVVLESIYRKQLVGHDSVQAAILGTDEVSLSIAASTLTTLVVFVPMLFVPGLVGLIFRDLVITICFSLFVSLAMALSFLPVFCSRFLKIGSMKHLHVPAHLTDKLHDYELSLADVEVKTGNRILDAIAGVLQRFLRGLDAVYEKILRWALRRSLVVILSAVGLLVLSVGSVLIVGMEFIPETDEGTFAISLETRIGASYEYTSAKAAEAERILVEEAGDSIRTMATAVGEGGTNLGLANTGSNLASISVALVDKGERDYSVWELVRRLERAYAANLLDVRVTIAISSMASIATTASGQTSAIVIQISGASLPDMDAYARRVAELIDGVEGTRNVSVSNVTGKPEIQFDVRRLEASSLGLSPLEIAATIRTAYKGATVTRVTFGAEDYDVVCMLEDADRSDLSRVTSLFFVNPAGTRIPLENVVEIRESTGPNSLYHENRTRVIRVSASLDGSVPLSRVSDAMLAGLDELGPPPVGVRVDVQGSTESMNESFSSLGWALLLALVLVYMIMASQFENLIYPLIIMFSIPFAAIGMIGMLLLTNTTFNILAFVGAILLVGVVVNNAILLIDYINILRRRGVEIVEAVVQGCKTRLKPILMTSGTTILGLLPMALGLGAGSELQAPIGRGVLGGLTTSTLVTLVLIPTIYWLVETKLRRKKGEG